MIPRKMLGALGTFAWIAALAAVETAAAFEPPFNAPTTQLLGQNFTGVTGIPPSWQVALGTWQADGDKYNSTTAASAAVTTLFEYTIPTPEGGTATEDHVPLDEYTVEATLRNRRSGAAGLVGLVYAYRDPANYFEVVFSPTGTAYLRNMSQGQMEILAAATYPIVAPTQSLRVVLKLERFATSVSVNGVPVFTKASFGNAGGQVGFSTYNTTAAFDDLIITFPWGQQAFTENFADGVADGFSAPPGTFVVSNGIYVDSAVHQTDMALAPIEFGIGSRIIFSYTLHVRMLNPYGGSGNLLGIVFDRNFSSTNPGYAEVVFAPTGVAQIRRVIGNTIEVLDSAPAAVTRNTWFTVTLSLGQGGFAVNIDGKPVFTNESMQLMSGKPEVLALITHWTPGRFDDFSFGYDRPVAASLQTFGGPLATGAVRSGTWDTQGGTLNDVSAGIADLVIPGNVVGQTDYRYKGRLLNQYVASGNLVGLVFGYRSPGDYLEAVFAPTGQAYLNQYLEGTRYRLATGTHTVPANVWFDVEIVQKGPTASVTINGKPAFQSVQVGDFATGAFGAVGHWSKARFDNLSIQEAP
jgi:hypothetical protein